MQYEKSIIINNHNGFVVNVIVGCLDIPGFTCMEWTPAHKQVSIGWKLENGVFVDKRSEYSPAKRFEKA